MAATSTGLRFFIALCLLLVGCGFALAQQVVVERESPLLAEPRADAPVVATLKQGTTAQQTGKQGAWLNVTTAAGAGWVLSFNVRVGSSQASASGSGTAARRAAPSQKPTITATIGIRGLDAEDLMQARFDEQQFNLFDSYGASKQAAEAAAAATGLTPVRVNYFDKK